MASATALPKNSRRFSIKNAATETKSASRQENKNSINDIKECLKILENTEAAQKDILDVTETLLSKPQLADHLQYELHIYCKKNLIKSDPSLVVKLAELCYSNVAVSHFNNMDRFVGCVYHICGYLLKNKKYTVALNIVNSLILKKEEIIGSTKKSPDIRNFLYNLHSIFISTAITIAFQIHNKSDKNYEISHKLAVASLWVFQLTESKQILIGKKVLKTSKLYLHTLKHFNDSDVSEFYDNLKIALNILLGTFTSVNYACYFLCKIEHMGKMEMEKSLEVFESLQNIVKILSIILNMPASILYNFESVLRFFFLVSKGPFRFDEFTFNNIQADSIQMKKYFKVTDPDDRILKREDSTFKFSDLDPINKVYFALVSTIFHYGIQCWWREYENNWGEKMSVLMLKKLILKMLEFYKFNCSLENLNCSSPNSSIEFCFGDVLAGNLQKMLYTIRLCFKNQLPDSNSLPSLSQEVFKLLMDCLNVMEEKKCCAMMRSSAWKHSVIQFTNIIEDILRISNCDESWKSLAKCAKELLSGIVSFDFELPYDFRRVNVIFQRWHHANLKSKQYQDSLFAAVLYFVSYPEEETEIMSMVLQAKKESANEIFQGVTLSEIAKSCSKAIENYKKNFKFSEFNMKPLLMMELRAYATCPLDTFLKPEIAFKLVSSIWKQLEKFSLTIYDKAVGLSFLVVTAAHGSEKRLSPSIEEKCATIINILKDEHKSKRNCKSLMLVGNLTFFMFLYHAKLVENPEENSESLQMILKFLQKEEEEKVKFGEDIDLNLTCNVIPTSSQLTVDLETNYLKALDEVVDIWTNALNSDLSYLPPTKFEYEMWLQNIKHIANLYELFGEHQRSVTTWLLYYKIGKLSEDHGAVLLGMSHLITNLADVEKSEIFTEAENISEKFNFSNKDKNILVEYFIAVASNYLKNKKPKNCSEYLSKAKKMLEGLKINVRGYTLNAKFWCLVSQFLCIYPDYEVEFGYKPKTDFRVMVFRAFSFANAGARNDNLSSALQGECTEAVLTMLEVNMWAYYFFGIYSKTDFMRFFLNDLYQIVQKLLLPTRIAEVLVRLAEVDMICEKIAECREKVGTLKIMLPTLSSKCEEIEKFNINLENPGYFPKVDEFSANDRLSPRAISPARFLDSNNLQKMCTSPMSLHLRSNQQTKSKAHTVMCKCRPCQNLLIQILTMDVLALEGEMNQKGEDQSRNKSDSFNQACDIMNKLERLQLEQTEILQMSLRCNFKYNPGEMDFQAGMVRFHSARFLIKLGFYESSKSKASMDELGKTLENISRLMMKFSYEEKILQWTFTELKLCVCLLNQEEKDKTPKRNILMEYKTPAFTKTPIDNRWNQGLSTVKANRIKIPDIDVSEKENEASNGAESQTDEKNTAFIGKPKLPKEEKRDIHSKRLSFRTNEPATNVKTVIKAPTGRTAVIKPRKLNLEELESSEEKKSSKKKVSESKQTEINPPTKATSVKPKAEPISKVKIHVDSVQKEKKPLVRGSSLTKNSKECGSKKVSVTERTTRASRAKKS